MNVDDEQVWLRVMSVNIRSDKYDMNMVFY